MARHFSEFTPSTMPPELEPLSPWAYFGLTVLFSIPVIGTIFLIVFAISGANINRRNFARSYFVALLFLLIVFVILHFTGALAPVYEELSKEGWSKYYEMLPWVM